jgi:hypothetical protein
MFLHTLQGEGLNAWLSTYVSSDVQSQEKLLNDCVEIGWRSRWWRSVAVASNRVERQHTPRSIW